LLTTDNELAKTKEVKVRLFEVGGQPVTSIPVPEMQNPFMKFLLTRKGGCTRNGL
jgi:hypothetical protein